MDFMQNPAPAQSIPGLCPDHTHSEDSKTAGFSAQKHYNISFALLHNYYISESIAFVHYLGNRKQPAGPMPFRLLLFDPIPLYADHVKSLRMQTMCMKLALDVVIPCRSSCACTIIPSPI